MEEEEFYTKEFSNLGEIDILIEKMENNIPDKRTKDYEEFKNKINFLFEKYNKLAKFKAFKKYE